MAMSVGQDSGDEDVPMSDINTTPLVDVMLVLLIIFLITVPVVIQTIPVKLPTVRNEITQTKPQNVSLSVRNGANGTCEVYWGLKRMTQKEMLQRGVDTLKKLIADVGGVQNVNDDNMPEVHIRGDINTQYKCIGAAIITMQSAGFQRIGFISQPHGSPNQAG